MYFKETGAKDLEIAAWADGDGSTSTVQGQVRSVEFRSPVPPAPMCPKETRVTSTWHVAALADKVVLEAVCMSLDVPCGTSFNSVTCDTFTVVDGVMKMVRTCGVEWVQESWTKSLVEKNVPVELGTIGQKMANVVQKWMHHN